MFENENLKTNLSNAGYFIVVSLAVFTITFALLYFANLVPKSFQSAEKSEGDVEKIIEADKKEPVEKAPLTITKPTKITIDSKFDVRKQTDFRLPSLDYAFLDYIDSVCERNGGSGGIPNQEKTNQLWKEFQKKKSN